MVVSFSTIILGIVINDREWMDMILDRAIVVPRLWFVFSSSSVINVHAKFIIDGICKSCKLLIT